MRNVECNNANVLECKTNWQVKSHKVGDTTAALKWISEGKGLSANVEVTSGSDDI